MRSVFQIARSVQFVALNDLFSQLVDAALDTTFGGPGGFELLAPGEFFDFGKIGHQHVLNLLKTSGHSV